AREDAEPGLEDRSVKLIGSVEAAEDKSLFWESVGRTGLPRGDWLPVVDLIGLRQPIDLFRVRVLVLRRADYVVDQGVIDEVLNHGAMIAQRVDLQWGGAKGEGW